MIKIIRIYFTAIVLAAVLTGCDSEPVFTEMATNRLTIKIKGTLESEGGSNFDDLYDPDGLSAISHLAIQDDSVVDYPASSANELPTEFMLDLAEIRLGGKKISNYRQVFKFDLKGNKTTEAEPFFNGTGVVLKNDDPPEGRYDTVQLYIRKMVFDGAQVYRASGSGFVHDGPSEVIFHEKTVNGFDFNQLMVNSHWDSLRLESADILRIFPLEVPIIGGLDYSRYDPETVLEIRLVVKNFIKKYEYSYFSWGGYKVAHYYAFSDWLRDVRSGDDYIGRNIHAVARAYVPGKTGTVTVTGLNNDEYVIMIPDSENVNDYKTTKAGSALRTDNNYDFPLPPKFPGNYIEAVLDYYLMYEKYKYDWQLKYALIGSPSFEGYQAAWDTYEDSVKNFKIAPFVGFGDSVTFEHVPPGLYKLYRAAKPDYGDLFHGAVFTEESVTVPVNINGDHSVSF